MLQLGDTLQNVVESAVSTFFLVARCAWVPAFYQFFDGTNIDAAVVEKFVQFWHLGIEETAVLANCITTK